MTTGAPDEVVIAALFVEPGGAYFNLPNVDPWDEKRDARLYDGPYPVVAHSPCARWGRYWWGSSSSSVRYTKGDDGGCFAAALASVRRWGGVLEHPAGSFAWAAFSLNAPPAGGGWVEADQLGGWTCHVEQGNYGHKAPKPTWLYACGTDLPVLKWGKSNATASIDGAKNRRVREPRVRGVRSPHDIVECLSKKQRAATPLPFRDLLLDIAATAYIHGLEIEIPRCRIEEIK